MFDVKMSPRAMALVGKIEKHTTIIANLYLEMASGRMSHAEQANAMVTLASEGVQLARATAGLFIEAESTANELRTEINANAN